MPRPFTSHLPGLTRVSTLFANAWLVDAPDGWVLVDTGLPGYAGRIVHSAERRYGKGTRPHAIVLTHGHLDHSGSAARLAWLWNVPVFVHRYEMPFLDGRLSYPPPDPACRGPLAALARTLPVRSRDLRLRLRDLPRNGSVPFLPGWAWLLTPGHTPGHVSLLRGSDRLLLAGDALCAADAHAGTFTMDRRASQHTMQALAALSPWALATGHGPPRMGPEVPALMRAMAYEPAPRALALGLVALSAALALAQRRRSTALA